MQRSATRRSQAIQPTRATGCRRHACGRADICAGARSISTPSAITPASTRTTSSPTRAASAPTAGAMSLPTDAQGRKDIPLYRGLLKYFPDALAAVADCSRIGNDQHNAGEELHWARSKSSDQLDAAVRHILDAGKRDSDGVRHMAKAAWRVLAELQL